MQKLIGPSEIPFHLDIEIMHENLYATDFYQEEEDYYTKLLLSYTNPIAFDVGSNIGYFSCLFKSAGCKQVHCFEPINEPYEKSIKNLSQFIDRSIIVNKIALYNRIMKQKKMFVSVSHNQGSTISKDIVSKFKNVFKPNKSDKLKDVIISTNTLDNYCKVNNVSKIHLLKIDTEGTELHVLLGGLKMIKNKKIENIIYESYIPEEIYKFLTSNDYSIQEIKGLKQPMFHAKPNYEKG